MTIVVYLHGVGDDGTRRDWWDTLTAAQPGRLAVVPIIAPDYSDLLSRPLGEIGDVPPAPRTSGPAPSVSRRRYREAQAALNRRLLDCGSDSVWPFRRRGFSRVPAAMDAVGELLITGAVFDEVGHYIDQHVRRRAVLHRVLASLGAQDDRRMVLLGHSLGALVALEVVRHLPTGWQVPLLVTAASALARRRLPPDLVDLTTRFPYDRVGGWINVFNPRDPVTRGLPIGARFPQAIDVSLHAGFADHRLAACLADSGVARAVGTAATASGGPLNRSTTADGGPSFTRELAVAVSRLQYTFHVEQLLARDPATSVSDLTRILMGRRVVGERTERLGLPGPWDRDLAGDLRAATAETDLPSVLVCLAGDSPFTELGVPVPPAVDQRARRLVAMDAGVPAGWVDVAAASLADVPFGPGAGAPTEPSDPSDAVALARVVRDWLRPLALPDPAAAGPRDLRPLCMVVVARALTAHRLGMPHAAARERHCLSELMVILGTQRAASGGASPSLAAALRRGSAVVADSLSWLAAHGIGLEAVR